MHSADGAREVPSPTGCPPRPKYWASCVDRMRAKLFVGVTRPGSSRSVRRCRPPPARPSAQQFSALRRGHGPGADRAPGGRRVGARPGGGDDRCVVGWASPSRGTKHPLAGAEGERERHRRERRRSLRASITAQSVSGKNPCAHLIGVGTSLIRREARGDLPVGHLSTAVLGRASRPRIRRSGRVREHRLWEQLGVGYRHLNDVECNQLTEQIHALRVECILLELDVADVAEVAREGH